MASFVSSRRGGARLTEGRCQGKVRGHSECSLFKRGGGTFCMGLPQNARGCDTRAAGLTCRVHAAIRRRPAQPWWKS